MRLPHVGSSHSPLLTGPAQRSSLCPVPSTPPPPQVKLASFEVQNFRLFRRERLVLHPDVTVVVGLNDAGKSTLLAALFTYSRVGTEGFRDLLLEEEELGTGPSATRFTATWQISGEPWSHSVTLDPENPHERLEQGDFWWSWSPKERLLDSHAGKFQVHSAGSRWRSLAQFDERRWQLDTAIKPEIYQPLGVAKYFRTSTPYLFQPLALAAPARLDIETPAESGYGWAVWLQQIINRRDGDLEKMEGTLRDIFPFFGRVRVQEERVRIERTLEEFGASELAASVTKRKRMKGAPPQSWEQISRNLSSRDVVFEMRGEHEGVRAPASSAKDGAQTLLAPEVLAPRGEPPPRVLKPRAMSSGLLLALAHLTASYALTDTPMVLVEEPENGLNRRIMLDMMRAILDAYRERGHQLVMTTHHGWWLDLVPPEAIRVLMRDETGGHVNTPDAAALRHALDELDLYPSEVMNTYGPEGLLGVGQRR
jgi:AAA ATPase domain/AAA domain, putative AbiEii toxin, Type IV TA system